MRNRVQLIGNLGQNPEVKEIANGKAMAKFSMATNESYRNAKGEKVTDTEWHNIVAFGKLADIIGKYLKKGNEVAVEGRLKTSSYEDKEGIKRYSTDIIIDDMVMLGNKA